jgi:hypothetical protein
MHIPGGSKISRRYSGLTSRNLVMVRKPTSEVSLWWRFSCGLWQVRKTHHIICSSSTVKMLMLCFFETFLAICKAALLKDAEDQVVETVKH